jgi:serine O-acetyltransferase
MTTKELKSFIVADFRRMSNSNSIATYFKYMLMNSSFKITFWFRVGSYLKEKRNIVHRLMYVIVYFIHKHNQYLTGIQLAFGTSIGKGLFFPHFSCIVISSSSKIGDNCTIFHGVSLGAIRGKGDPHVGNNVVFATGAKILGNVTIGNDVFVGANSVVVKDIPDNAVVVGIPAKIINMDGYRNTRLY